jgi:hypothetical protein
MPIEPAADCRGLSSAAHPDQEAALFGGKQARKRRKRLLCALERLQDGIGELNDIAAYEERIAAIGIRRRRSSAKRAFATGPET